MEPEDAGLGNAESQFRWELVPGTRWMTLYCADPFVVAYDEAPPPYATQDLGTSWCGSQMAALGAHCSLCEAVALPEELVGEAVVSRKVPHAPSCTFSAETIARLDAGCRPPGYQAPPVTDEEVELLATALAGLHKFHRLMTAG